MGSDSPNSAAKPPRALALDALRGMAILAMCLSGVVPFYRDTLPAWMYHAQKPPPTHAFNPGLPGYTWVDLVFPLFLFSMGAAFPLALSRRLAKGTALWRMILGILGRGVSLAFFAVYVQNLAPYAMDSSPGVGTWLVALLGFGLLFPIYARFPKSWSIEWQWYIRMGGVLAALFLMSSITYPDGGRWTVRRFDIIIMVLANMAVFGSLLWLLTRGRIYQRVIALGILYAALETYKVSCSWLNVLLAPHIRIGEWKLEFGWLTNFAWLKYLFIVVPGTIAGDQLLAWMRDRGTEKTAWCGWRLNVYAGLLFAVVVLLHVTLQGRWLVAALIGSGVILAGAFWLARTEGGKTEDFLRQLIGWGTLWLALGLLFEPVEGGVKKDPSNMSYYFVSSAMSCFLLASLTVWIDLFGLRRTFGLFISNGQNPMIAYAGIRNFLAPVVSLTGVESWAIEHVFKGPWPRALWGAIKTAFLGVAVSICTRLKIFWRT